MSATGTILLINDCEDDVQLFKRSAKVVGLTNPIQCVDTVDRAFCYLKGEGELSDRDRYPMPFLVMLDLKLFGKSGLKVLQWIRSQPDLWCVIVIAMTSSEDPSVMKQAYQLGANSFLVKPFGSDAINHMIRGIEHYWVTLNRTGSVPRLGTDS